jgi:hypothetical protein
MMWGRVDGSWGPMDPPPGAWYPGAVSLRRWTTCAAALLAHLGPGVAWAEPGTSDAETTARLAFIERALARDEVHTRLWSDGWTGFFGAAALAQAGLAGGSASASARITALAGAAKASIGFGFMIVSPATGRTAASVLRALPSGTPEQRRDKLRRAEALLRTVATEERFRRSWFPSIGGAFVNIAGAWVVLATTRDATAGWLGLATGVLVSQAHRFTQPTAAIDAWAAYCRGDIRPRPARASVSVVPVPGGLSLRASF